MATADAGIGEHGGQRRQTQRGAEPLAEAGHRRARGIEADRNVGADRCGGVEQARIVGREAVGCGERAQRRGRVARAAAEARGDRQDFQQMEAPEPEPRNALGERARRAQNEIVVGRPGGRGGRPVDRQAQRVRRLERKPIAAAGEGDDAVELVPAVGRGARARAASD